jgi:surfeit locus 1 family protein
VTPLLLDGTTTTLWVLRGFVASADAVTPPSSLPAADTGDVTLQGIALAIPVTSDGGAPLEHNGDTTYKRLDHAALEQRRRGSLPVYLLLTSRAPGDSALTLAPPPALTDGPHLSYALQWFGIALAAVTFGIIIFWRDGRASPPQREAP